MNKPVFTDTHTHLYLDEFRADRDRVLQKAEQAGIHYIFLPNIDSSSVKPMLELCKAWPHLCYPMTGLHPGSVGPGFREELAKVKEYLLGMRFYAIGEIGIDLYWDRTYEKEQIDAFNLQLDLALEYGLPVAVHTRNSMDVALEILESRNDKGLRGVFHCFSGNTVQAEKAIRLGFYLGIGGVVTYKNSGLQKVVEAMPLDSLLLETDAPYLPPVPYRGQRNEPSYIPLIARKISEVKKISIEEVAEITTQNALKLFKVNLHE